MRHKYEGGRTVDGNRRETCVRCGIERVVPEREVGNLKLTTYHAPNGRVFSEAKHFGCALVKSMPWHKPSLA